ncbi:hypothetical protein H0H92_005587 [Tricholoma furcatifolium]|nr:hypothetical protein H0H92_005587 [Tricholoma furcatifolium]
MDLFTYILFLESRGHVLDSDNGSMAESFSERLRTLQRDKILRKERAFYSLPADCFYLPRKAVDNISELDSRCDNANWAAEGPDTSDFDTSEPPTYEEVLAAQCQHYMNIQQCSTVYHPLSAQSSESQHESGPSGTSGHPQLVDAETESQSEAEIRAQKLPDDATHDRHLDTSIRSEWRRRAKHFRKAVHDVKDRHMDSIHSELHRRTKHFQMSKQKAGEGLLRDAGNLVGVAGAALHVVGETVDAVGGTVHAVGDVIGGLGDAISAEAEARCTKGGK